MEHCFSLSVTREVAFVCELGVTEWQKNSVSPAKCLGAKERQKRAVEVDEGAGRSRSMARPKAIFTKNRSEPETGTGAKWIGNIRVQ